MVYLICKWLHVVAVVLWLSGMLAPLFLWSRSSRSPELRQLLRSYDLKVTSPAMALVWVLGLAMAVQANWWVHGWFRVKLLLVVSLSALHGVYAGRLRRDSLTQPDRLWIATLILLLGVVGLVVVKPI